MSTVSLYPLMRRNTNIFEITIFCTGFCNMMKLLIAVFSLKIKYAANTVFS